MREEEEHLHRIILLGYQLRISYSYHLFVIIIISYLIIRSYHPFFYNFKIQKNLTHTQKGSYSSLYF